MATGGNKDALRNRCSKCFFPVQQRVVQQETKVCTMADPTYPLLVQAMELGASTCSSDSLYTARRTLSAQRERESPASAALVVTSVHFLGLTHSRYAHPCLDPLQHFPSFLSRLEGLVFIYALLILVLYILSSEST